MNYGARYDRAQSVSRNEGSRPASGPPLPRGPDKSRGSCAVGGPVPGARVRSPLNHKNASARLQLAAPAEWAGEKM